MTQQAFLDEPPQSTALTNYDRAHMKLYMRLLDAGLGLPGLPAERHPAVRRDPAARAKKKGGRRTDLPQSDRWIVFEDYIPEPGP